MGKEARNKNQAPANSNEVQGTGARLLQEDEANFRTLDKTLTDLLGAVKNITLQVDEISSTVSDLVKRSKNVDSTRDVVGEFQNLKQTTSVAEYQEKFEELRDLMVKMNYGLSEDSLVSCFLRGLKPDVKESTANLKPKTLYHAFNLARIQEIAIDEMKRKAMKTMEKFKRESNLENWIWI